MSKRDDLSPVAQHVIRKCGGVLKVAELLGLAKVTVHKFTYPRARGGTGGNIPHWHRDPLIEKATAEGIDLGPLDFVEAPHGLAVFPDEGAAA